MQKYEPLFMHVILFKFQCFSPEKKKSPSLFIFPSTKLTTKHKKKRVFNFSTFLSVRLHRGGQAVNVC